MGGSPDHPRSAGSVAESRFGARDCHGEVVARRALGVDPLRCRARRRGALAPYPSRLKRRLGPASPALLYGCGNQLLLDRGGLAVVGSRNAADDDLQYTRELGTAAANEGFSIVSGGARGVDETAMLGALESEGTAVGVLADSLLRACSSAKYRRHLLANNLVLISTFHPEAGFNSGNAMQRNKYIYCLSDAAVVVHSGVKGGTWNGATENLNKRWVPLWVKPTGDAVAGNHGLEKQGGRWLPEGVSDVNVKKLFIDGDGVSSEADVRTAEEACIENSTLSRKEEPGQIRVGSSPSSSMDTQQSEKSEFVAAFSNHSSGAAGTAAPAPENDGDRDSPNTPSLNDARTLKVDLDLYDHFLQKLSKVCTNTEKTPDELAELFDLNKTQVNAWLKRAVTENKLQRHVRPVRYEWISAPQALLFDS